MNTSGHILAVDVIKWALLNILHLMHVLYVVYVAYVAIGAPPPVLP